MVKNFLKLLKQGNKYFSNQFRIKILRAKGAKIGKNVFIGKRFRVDHPAQLIIEDYVYIGDSFYANCIGGLEIGKGSIISNNCVIVTYNHNYHDENILPYGIDNELKPVHIGEAVWIGINAVLCGGIYIGDKAIVGMGTTVSKNVEPDVVFAGGRVIRSRENNMNNAHYYLMQVRNNFNPLHYFTFWIKTKSLFKSVNSTRYVTIDKIQEKYRSEDCLVILGRFAEFHNLHIDYKARTINRNSSDV